MDQNDHHHPGEPRRIASGHAAAEAARVERAQRRLALLDDDLRAALEYAGDRISQAAFSGGMNVHPLAARRHVVFALTKSVQMLREKVLADAAYDPADAHRFDPLKGAGLTFLRLCADICLDAALARQRDAPARHGADAPAIDRSALADAIVRAGDKARGKQ